MTLPAGRLSRGSRQSIRISRTPVIYANGIYYAYSTQVHLDNVPFRTSIDGVHWSPENGNAMPVLPSWATFAYTWAPTVTNVGGNHYLMFFVARDTASGAQCIGKAESSSPSGPFVDSAASPFICDPSGGGDIDPHIFSDPTTGQLYLIWKLNSNAVGEPTSLWVAPLDSGFNLVGFPHELLTADLPWQQGNIERPDMIEENGVYYLFYAGNDYYSASYGIGYATCDSPLGPCVDSPNGPMLRSAGGMSGPGGPSLFRGPDGLELAFSAWAGKVGYGDGGYRALYVASVTFRDGVPHVRPLTSTEGDLS
jgi:beta-xylosidase